MKSVKWLDIGLLLGCLAPGMLIWWYLSAPTTVPDALCCLFPLICIFAGYCLYQLLARILHV